MPRCLPHSQGGQQMSAVQLIPSLRSHHSRTTAAPESYSSRCKLWCSVLCTRNVNVSCTQGPHDGVGLRQVAAMLAACAPRLTSSPGDALSSSAAMGRRLRMQGMRLGVGCPIRPPARPGAACSCARPCASCASRESTGTRKGQLFPAGPCEVRWWPQSLRRQWARLAAPQLSMAVLPSPAAASQCTPVEAEAHL